MTQPSETKDDSETYYYFGYGSNMSLGNLKMKLIDVKSINFSRGILKDYKLVFNITIKNNPNGMGNITPSIGDSVHGAYYQLTKEQMKIMDTIESTYKRIIVDIIPYENSSGETIKCTAYISTPQILKELKIYDKFVVHEINSDSHIKPSENYLNTIIRAAKDIKLNENYINMLKKKEFHKIITLNDLSKEEVLHFYSRINEKTFTIDDIKNSEKSNNPLCHLTGIVLSIKNSMKVIQQRFCGKDMTQAMQSRYYLYDYYLKDKNKYENEVMKYVKGEMIYSRNHYIIGKIVGKLEHKMVGYNQFGWEQDFNKILN